MNRRLAVALSVFVAAGAAAAVPRFRALLWKQVPTQNTGTLPDQPFIDKNGNVFFQHNVEVRGSFNMPNPYTPSQVVADGGFVAGAAHCFWTDPQFGSSVCEDSFGDLLLCGNSDGGDCVLINASTGQCSLPGELDINAVGAKVQHVAGQEICGTQNNGCSGLFDGGIMANEFFVPSNLSSLSNPIAYATPRQFLWCPGGTSCIPGTGPDPVIYAADSGWLIVGAPSGQGIMTTSTDKESPFNANGTPVCNYRQIAAAGNQVWDLYNPCGGAAQLQVGASDAGGAFIGVNGSGVNLVLQGSSGGGTGVGGPVVQNFGTDNFGTLGNGVNIQIDGGITCIAGGAACLPKTDHYLSIYDSVTLVGTTGDIWVAPAASQSAMTLQGANTTVQVAGGGTGTLTAKLSSAASGGGTVFATCTTACNGAVNLVTACTVNTAAVPAGTTLHYAITTACTTADVANVVGILFSQP